MSIKTILESIVVGLAAQVAVGWISPFTPLLAGFIAGVINRNEKEGTIVGFFVGFLTAMGFVLRMYLNLSLVYIYPTTSFIDKVGYGAVYIIIVIMIAIGTIGGRVGGSIMQRSMERSYKRGEMIGEAKRNIEEFYEEPDRGKKSKRK